MFDTKIPNGIPDAESTPSTLEEIENKWINEHARQVFSSNSFVIANHQFYNNITLKCVLLELKYIPRLETPRYFQYGNCVSEKSSINNDPGSLQHRHSFGSSCNPALHAARMHDKPLRTSVWDTKILESEHFFFSVWPMP